MESNYVDFIDLSKPKYDQTTYFGRFWHCLEICGPLSWKTLFVNSKQLKESTEFVQRYDRWLDPIEAENYYKHKQRIDVAIHPDTNQPIPWIFRMSAHVPANTVLLFGMVFSKGVPLQAAWQLANQVFNAGQFYSNKNKTNDVSNARLFWATTFASIAAVSATFGLNKIITGRYQFLVPFLAAAAGKPLQIPIMRVDEFTEGIALYNSEGEFLGTSRIAGAVAVSQTIATRVLYLIQPFVVPPLFSRWLEKKPYFQLRPNLLKTINIGVIAMCSAVATPMCIALFSQNARLSTKHLESSLQKEIPNEEYVYFNKGL